MAHTDLLIDFNKKYLNVETRLTHYCLKDEVVKKYNQVLLKRDLVFTLVKWDVREMSEVFHQDGSR